MLEFDLIRKLQEIICPSPVAGNGGCRVGIGDDGAVLDVPGDRELVVCTDSLVGGIHFLHATDPEAIGHKALAVNLSDLAAMGARPAWFFMALTIPTAEAAWLEAFAGGMGKLAKETGIMLAGGDVTMGPLSITITALGLTEKDGSLLRSGARDGDRIVVSGAPGAAAHALRQLGQGLEPAVADRAALDYPQPRVALGLALRGVATACIDISDGLAADLAHILESSGAGAEVELDRIPCPDSLAGLQGGARWPLQLSGGDDYELCFTIPAQAESRLAGMSRACGVRLTAIGKVTARPGLRFRDREGNLFDAGCGGYQHFESAAGETD